MQKIERISLILNAYLNPITKKIIINILYQSTYMLIRLLFIAFLADKYHLSILGEYALILTISIFFNFLCGLEIITGIAKNILKNKSTTNYINIIYTWALFVITLFYVVMKYFYQGNGNIEIISIVLFFEFLTSELVRLLTLLSKNYLAIFVQFTKQVLWIPIFILCSSYIESKEILNTIILFWLGGLSLSLVIVFLKYKKFRPKLINFYKYKNYITRIIQKIKYYLAIAVLANLTIYSDRIFINIFLGAKELGSYFYYQTLASPVIGLIQAAVLTVLYPNFFNAKNNSLNYLNKNILNVALLSCGLSLLIYFFLEYIFPEFLIKENIKKNNTLLVAIFIGNIFYNISTVCHLMLLPKSTPSKFFILTFFCFVIQQILFISLTLMYKENALIYYSFSVQIIIFFIKYQYAKGIYVNN